MWPHKQRWGLEEPASIPGTRMAAFCRRSLLCLWVTVAPCPGPRCGAWRLLPVDQGHGGYWEVQVPWRKVKAWWALKVLLERTEEAHLASPDQPGGCP